jgi:hypothetical protein
VYFQLFQLLVQVLQQELLRFLCLQLFKKFWTLVFYLFSCLFGSNSYSRYFTFHRSLITLNKQKKPEKVKNEREKGKKIKIKIKNKGGALFLLL